MPGWLRTILLVAGLLIAAAFAAELALAITRRHRQADPAGTPAGASADPAGTPAEASADLGDTPAATDGAEPITGDAEPGTASLAPAPSVPAPPAPHPLKAGTCAMNSAQTRILMADYDRLIVTHNKAADLICVLRPPGEDPKAILRVARLILKENPYEQLATQLGIPASWPMD